MARKDKHTVWTFETPEGVSGAVAFDLPNDCIVDVPRAGDAYLCPACLQPLKMMVHYDPGCGPIGLVAGDCRECDHIIIVKETTRKGFIPTAEQEA